MLLREREVFAASRILVAVQVLAPRLRTAVTRRHRDVPSQSWFDK